MGVVYNENRNEYKVFIPLGARKYKTFTYKVNRYGKEEAKRLAIEFRLFIENDNMYVTAQ